MRRKWFVPIAAAVVLMFSAAAAQAAMLRVVVVEVSDAATYVQEIERGRALLEKIVADAEYQAWLKGLDRVRKVVSESLYEEPKP